MGTLDQKVEGTKELLGRVRAKLVEKLPDALKAQEVKSEVTVPRNVLYIVATK